MKERKERREGGWGREEGGGEGERERERESDFSFFVEYICELLKTQ